MMSMMLAHQSYYEYSVLSRLFTYLHTETFKRRGFRVTGLIFSSVPGLWPGAELYILVLSLSYLVTY